MEATKKKELYGKLQQLSDMAHKIIIGLYDIAEHYYDDGDICNQLNSMAMDAGELCAKLGDNAILSETTACMVCGEEKEIAIGDLIGVIRHDGTVGSGSIHTIVSGNDETDVIIGIISESTHNFEGSYRANRIVPWLTWYNLCNKGWNKFVKSLASQKKSVSLSQRNGAFSIRVTDDVTGALYERNGLYLKDINLELIDEIKNVDYLRIE